MPSSVIRSFTHDAAKRELQIVFQSGRRYVYRDVPRTLFESMKTARSKGEFFNDHVRDRFRFEKRV